jgi:adenylate cyclase
MKVSAGAWKKHLVRHALGLAVVLAFLGHAARWYDLPLLLRLEAITYDERLRLTMPRGLDARIVILDIDERSLAEEGRWPWPRSRLALLLDRLLDEYKVRAVGFDVVFAEPDPGLAVLDQVAQADTSGSSVLRSAMEVLRPRLDHDREFAEKLKGRPVALGFYLTGNDVRANALPEPVLPAGVFLGRNVAVRRFQGFGSNRPELAAAAAGAGHFTPIADADGVLRRVPMLAEVDGAYYEPLSLAVVRLMTGSPPIRLVFTTPPGWERNYPGLEWIEAGPVRVPVDIEVAALVPYRGPEQSFPYVSITDVLQGRTPKAGLEGKVVLVGTTSPGLQDLRSTPVGEVYPGVEIHANLIAGMLDNTIKQRPPYVLGAEFALLALVGSAMALVLPLLNPLRATAATLAVLAAVIGLNLAIWQFGNLVLPLASGLVMIMLLFGLNMSYGFFVESRAKKQITGRFGQYVPPELVHEMAQNPDKFSMEGESRELSVLFSDVRGFTTISEELEPKELSSLMNEFLTPLTQVIHRHRGTIDKYMGDAIMAFWGAPLADEQHALHAVLAGLEMRTTMESLTAQFVARGWPALSIGVGVDTGRASVGNMGSAVRVAYTAMGNVVNTASRLEGLTKQYGVAMIVGEATRAACPGVVFRELDRVRPKGKNQPLAIYEPVGLEEQVAKPRSDELALWHHALKQYRAQEWDMAELQLIALQRMYPDAVLYREFAQRVAWFRANPPGPGWDGTWIAASK